MYEMGVEGSGISKVDVMPVKSGLGGGQSAINTAGSKRSVEEGGPSHTRPHCMAPNQ